MTIQAERSLQQEIMLRLRVLGVVAIPVPNSTFFPARTDAERTMVARIINQMKNTGMITVGAPDIVVAANGKCCFVELKRRASRDLLGKTRRAGQLSDAQKEFRAQSEKAGMAYRVCHDWDEVHAALSETGVL